MPRQQLGIKRVCQALNEGYMKQMHQFQKKYMDKVKEYAVVLGQHETQMVYTENLEYKLYF